MQVQQLNFLRKEWLKSQNLKKKQNPEKYLRKIIKFLFAGGMVASQPMSRSADVVHPQVFSCFVLSSIFTFFSGIFMFFFKYFHIFLRYFHVLFSGIFMFFSTFFICHFFHFCFLIRVILRCFHILFSSVFKY